MIGFETLMFGVVATAALGGLATTMRGVPPIVVGDQEFEDIEDNAESLQLAWLAAVVGLVGTGFLFTVIRASEGGWGTIVLFTLIPLYLTGLGAYKIFKHQREAKVARPGTLTVSESPLAPGRRVRFRLERPLVAPVALERTRARLVLSELVSSGRSSSWQPRHTLKLPNEAIEASGRGISATWEVDLPTEFAPARQGFLGFPKSTTNYRWELQIDTPTRDVPELDCRFCLPFTFARE